MGGGGSEDDISVLFQIASDMMPEPREDHGHALSTRKFECRHKIRIARDNDDRTDHVTQGEARNIKADPQVDTFLNNIEIEILIRECPGPSLQFALDPWFKPPLRWCDNCFTHSQGKTGFVDQSVIKRLRVPKTLGFCQLNGQARYRELDCFPRRIGIEK